MGFVRRQLVLTSGVRRPGRTMRPSIRQDVLEVRLRPWRSGSAIAPPHVPPELSLASVRWRAIRDLRCWSSSGATGPLPTRWPNLRSGVMLPTTSHFRPDKPPLLFFYFPSSVSREWIPRCPVYAFTCDAPPFFHVTGPSIPCTLQPPIFTSANPRPLSSSSLSDLREPRHNVLENPGQRAILARVSHATSSNTLPVLIPKLLCCSITLPRCIRKTELHNLIMLTMVPSN